MRELDWEYWLSLSKVKVWEACALSLKLDPRQLTQEVPSLGTRPWFADIPSDVPRFERHTFPSDTIFKQFHKRFSVALSYRGDHARFPLVFRSPYGPGDERIQSEIRLPDFVRWAINVVRWKGLPHEFAPLVPAPKARDSEVAKQMSALSGARASHIDPTPNENDWKANARAIGKEVHERNSRLSVEQIADKVHAEMKKRRDADKPGMTGRGGRVPSAGTIRRHALTGLKS